MRHAALAALVFMVVACETGGPPTASPTPTPAPNPADTRAADLRTHLDLLLGEQVMLIAKQAVAAINHTDDYESYTKLLASNTADLTELWRRAFGNTTATRLAASWDTQNSYLVAYTIGAATHDDTKRNTAMTNLTQKFVPEFSGLVSDASRLPLDPVSLLVTEQVLEDKAFIDDYAAQRWATFFTDLHRAYVQSARLGDALAIEIAHRFPDKFPGDPELRAVVARVSANTLLQERSYLLTMGTAAHLLKGPDESFAFAAVTTNASSVAAVFSTAAGATPEAMISALGDEALQLKNYAAGSAGKDAVTEAATRFGNLANASRQHAIDHTDALLKAVEDQRAKNYAALANDDRAAATSTQPIANAIRG